MATVALDPLLSLLADAQRSTEPLELIPVLESYPAARDAVFQVFREAYVRAAAPVEAADATGERAKKQRADKPEADASSVLQELTLRLTKLLVTQNVKWAQLVVPWALGVIAEIDASVAVPPTREQSLDRLERLVSAKLASAPLRQLVSILVTALQRIVSSDELAQSLTVCFAAVKGKPLQEWLIPTLATAFPEQIAQFLVRRLSQSAPAMLPFLFANTKSEAAIIERQLHAAQQEADCAALDLVAAKCPSVVTQLLLSVLDDLLAGVDTQGLAQPLPTLIAALLLSVNAFTCFVGGFFDRLQSEAVIERLAQSGSGAAQSFVNATIVVLEYRIGNFGPDSLRLVMLLQRLAQLDVGISRMSDVSVSAVLGDAVKQISPFLRVKLQRSEVTRLSAEQGGASVGALGFLGALQPHISPLTGVALSLLEQNRPEMAADVMELITSVGLLASPAVAAETLVHFFIDRRCAAAFDHFHNLRVALCAAHAQCWPLFIAKIVSLLPVMRADVFITCLDHLLQLVTLEAELRKRAPLSPTPTSSLLAEHAAALLALADEPLHSPDAPQLTELLLCVFRSLRDPVALHALVVLLVDKFVALLPEVSAGDGARPLTQEDQDTLRRAHNVRELLVALAEQNAATCECVIDRTLDFVFSDAAAGYLRARPAQSHSAPASSVSLLQSNCDRTIGMAPKFRPNPRFSLRVRPQAPSAADFESNHALVLQLLTECARTGASGAACLVQRVTAHLSSLHPQPPIALYDEALPRRTAFERDQWLLQLLLTNAIVQPLIETVVSVASPLEVLPLHPTLRSILANVIGDWNGEVAAARAAQSPHLPATERVMSILKKAEMLPAPLCNMGEVLYALSPREVVMSLMGAWTFLRDHLPTDGSFVGERRHWPANLPLGPYLRGVQVAARNNIEELAPLYGRIS